MSLSSLMTNLVNHTGNSKPIQGHCLVVHAYGDERPIAWCGGPERFILHPVVILGVNHHDIYKEPHVSRLLDVSVEWFDEYVSVSTER